MKGIPKLIGCGIAMSFFTLMLVTSTAQTGSDSLFGSTPDSTSDIPTDRTPIPQQIPVLAPVIPDMRPQWNY